MSTRCLPRTQRGGAARGGAAQSSGHRRRTIAALEKVEGGKNLAVVGHEGFAHQRCAVHKQLQDAQGPGNDRRVLGVEGLCGGAGKRGQRGGQRVSAVLQADQGAIRSSARKHGANDARVFRNAVTATARSALTLDGHDELGHDRQDFAAALCQEVLDALLREKVVGVLHLAEALKEHGKVVVVVQLVDADLKRARGRTRVVCMRDAEGEQESERRPSSRLCGRNAQRHGGAP